MGEKPEFIGMTGFRINHEDKIWLIRDAKQYPLVWAKLNARFDNSLPLGTHEWSIYHDVSGCHNAHSKIYLSLRWLKNLIRKQFPCLNQQQ